jgi:LCP family protein required for cell wall assembly
LIICGCLALTSAVFLVVPPRTNVLLLGVDRAPDETFLGRTDTIILTTFQPLKPYVGMLSIPRDLWVVIPGVGENRINTAHYFAEGADPGSGPEATMETIRQNFGVGVNYYVRIRFSGIKRIVETLGGLDFEFPEPMSIYPAGPQHLDGDQVLAFVRDRSNSDDFFRMAHGQLFLKSFINQVAMPKSWLRLPAVYAAGRQAIDTNLPVWYWPRLAFTILRVGADGIDNRVITRELTNPFTTSEGAQVLGPNWPAIEPLLVEMFGK